MKDRVHNLVVADSIASFIPQGAGVKVRHKKNTSLCIRNCSFYENCHSLDWFNQILFLPTFVLGALMEWTFQALELEQVRQVLIPLTGETLLWMP